jgi:hypothetical protein
MVTNKTLTNFTRPLNILCVAKMSSPIISGLVFVMGDDIIIIRTDVRMGVRLKTFRQLAALFPTC